MTAAAAWRTKKNKFAGALLIAFSAMSLAGCETGGGLFGQSGPGPAAQAPPPPAAPMAKIAIAPIIGAPEAVSKPLQTQLGAAFERQNVTVAKLPTDKAEYTARGYVVALSERNGTKISYIWDFTDPAGNKVNRITGEEIVAGPRKKDPWSVITPQVIDKIAAKTSATTLAWMAKQGPGPVATQPGAGPVAAATTGGAAGAGAAGAGATGVSPIQTAGIQGQTTPSPAPGQQTMTGSIDRNAPMSAVVAGISGAPGDGSVSLTAALQKELTKSGFKLAPNAATPSYKVTATVVVGQAANGKQPVNIAWRLSDPADTYVGTVTQNNEVPQGSLDGPWGETADAAANSAAQGIVELIEKKKKELAASKS